MVNKIEGHRLIQRDVSRYRSMKSNDKFHWQKTTDSLPEQYTTRGKQPLPRPSIQYSDEEEDNEHLQ